MLADEGIRVRPLLAHRWWVPTTLASVLVGVLVLAATAALMGT